ncbi:hypothetical protein KFL_002960130 [Klebsormidium nitens]|uniref:Uncharacterized protein n=1 Tax=Klebsormidium nitens TaxID=105231 RepID=A0A1Y1IEM1_KLENI|nr:hypothetical protein KFL_002960130 [Klebsormidium nitens]|eukprot:GAQ86558.1 hypothetical protein KFL_002960130 [Klebsormidium nitens]
MGVYEYLQGAAVGAWIFAAHRRRQESRLRHIVRKEALLPLSEKFTDNQGSKRSSASANQPAPSPSVVIPWVFQEVAESLNEMDYFRRSVMLEKHASRLRLCWQKHGAEFPKTFAAELLRLPGTDVWETGRDPSEETGPDSEDDIAEENQKSVLLTFFLNTFAAEDEHTANLRIKRGSTELWRPVLEEIKRASVNKGPDWTSPKAAQFRAKVLQLMVKLEAAGESCHLWSLGYCHSYYEYERGHVTKNAIKLMGTLEEVREKIAGVERDAAKVAMEAKKEPIKASLKPAPWEVD